MSDGSVEPPAPPRARSLLIVTGMTARRTQARGFALLDALFAMALLTFAAVATASLVHGAMHQARHAERLDRARAACETILARLSQVSWHALPERFGGTPGDELAILGTAFGTAPADWPPLLTPLPEGQATARLEGLGPGGAGAPFASAVALRIRVEVSYRQGNGARRAARLTAVRF